MTKERKTKKKKKKKKMMMMMMMINNKNSKQEQDEEERKQIKIKTKYIHLIDITKNKEERVTNVGGLVVGALHGFVRSFFTRAKDFVSDVSPLRLPQCSLVLFTMAPSVLICIVSLPWGK